MVSLFKSKKTQNATAPPQVKEQASLTAFAPRSAEPSAGTPGGSIRDREKEKDREKDGNASRTGSPPEGGWDNPSNVPSSVSLPAMDQKPLREKPEPDVQAPRAGTMPPPGANNPNAQLYPWSQRRFQFMTSHPNPFPRYGAAVNALASKDGEIYMMGGLINGSMVKGDLWMVEPEGPILPCYPIPTTAEGPGPRVGHASLIVGNAFIVFGGDTKIDERDDLDHTLYLLNTATRSWTRATSHGVRPAGRYGHTLNIVNSKLYVFGGQVEGHFFNDLVAFDLNGLQVPGSQWELLIPDSADPSYGPVPPARTNHTIVNWGDKLFLFGGTNSHQWFNDVWTYDPRTNRWTQLDCIGYIPVPREGHAAALVGDVMYIFGGRTEEGNDLGDLAAFRISSRRWYTFQNMGPSPSPRSGHSMTSYGKQIIVLGGEPSSAPRDPVELSLVYTLDTGKIRYPADQPSPGPGNRRPSGGDRTQPPMARAPPSRDGAVALEGRDPRMIAGGPRQSLVGGAIQHPRAADVPAPNGPAVGMGSRLPRAAAAQAPSGPPPAQQAPPPRTNGILPMPPGPRSKTPTRAERTMSPAMDSIRSGSLERDNASPVKQDGPGPSEQPAVNGRRTPTGAIPQQRQPPPARLDESESTTSVESLGRSRSLQGRQQQQQQQQRQQHQAPAGDVSEAPAPKQPSPDWRRGEEASWAPRDTSRRRSSSESRMLPQLRHQNDELLKELAATKGRNAWYASELALARRAGYVPNPSDSPMLDAKAAEAFGEKDRPLLEAFLAMRAELERVQGSIASQATLASSKVAEAENQRDIAVSEAVYAKAKLAAHGGSQASTPQLDSSSREVGDREAERTAGMDRRLASSLALQAELQSRLARFEAELKSERQARQLAENLADAAEIRVADLDSFKQRASSGLEGLRAELHQVQKLAREEASHATEAGAAAKMLRAERDDLNRKLDEAVGMSTAHATAAGSMRDAVVASTDKASLLERKLEDERHHHENVDRKLRQLRAEHEEMTAELETVTRRLRDAEEMVEAHSAEADKHRAAMLSGLGQVADRDLGGLHTVVTEERVGILQTQVDASTALVRKSQAAADAAAEKLRAAEERIAGLEAYQEQMSREGLGIRRQLQGAVKQTQALQAENAEIRAQLANQQLEANAIAVQHGALKDLLGERGVNASELRRSRSVSRQDSGSGTPDLSRLRDVEQQLEASVKAQNSLQNQLRAREQDADRVYREKLDQLQHDYQSAVHYIKGTEKMLSKYKTQNAHLQSELDQVHRARSAESTRAAEAPAAWQAERRTLQEEIEKLQSGVNSSIAQLERQMSEMRDELDRTQQERDQFHDSSRHLEQELALLAEQARADLEQLKHENSLLEARAQDAEQRVVVLLDQLVTSVDNYRRQSRLIEPNGVLVGGGDANSSTGAEGGAGGGGGSGSSSSGHRRDNSSASELSRVDSSLSSSPARGGGGGSGPVAGSGTEGLSSFQGDARNSVALDSLASELETLRSHWESTNKHYYQQHSNLSQLDRQAGGGAIDGGSGVAGINASGAAAYSHDGGVAHGSRGDDDTYGLSSGLNTFDFERTPTSIDGGELSNSLANWRRRLDLEEQEAAAAAAATTAGGPGTTVSSNPHALSSPEAGYVVREHDDAIDARRIPGQALTSKNNNGGLDGDATPRRKVSEGDGVVTSGGGGGGGTGPGAGAGVSVGVSAGNAAATRPADGPTLI